MINLNVYKRDGHYNNCYEHNWNHVGIGTLSPNIFNFPGISNILLLYPLLTVLFLFERSFCVNMELNLMLDCYNNCLYIIL